MTGWRVAVLLALYPPSWRRRYGTELAALVASDGSTQGWRVAGDLAAGAAREWLWLAALVGHRATARDRALGGVARAVWLWAMCVIGFGIVQKTTEQWQWGPLSSAKLALLNRNADVCSQASGPALIAPLIAVGLMLSSTVGAVRTGGWRGMRYPAVAVVAGSAAAIAAGIGVVV